MKTSSHFPAILSLIFLPLVVLIIVFAVASTLGISGDTGLSLALIFSTVFGIPLIAFIGMIVGLLTRKRDSARTLLLIGYAVPSSLVVLYQIIATIVSYSS